jgi:CheY-like chemotaxis protein
MINLLSNAVKYNRRGGSVTVTYQADGGEVRVNVTDTGLGIPAGHLNDLFTPFERLGADQTEVEGTGLGLALTKKLVEALGGTIEVDSRENVGSTFSITLPLIDAPVPVSPKEKRSEDLAGDVLPMSRVLYVEDNGPNIRLMQRFFSRRPELQLSVAMTGAEALATLRAERPEVLLLDVNLPDMSGSAVLHEIRSDPSLADLPVVGLSADATQEQVQKFLDEGADDYVTKPVDFDRLLLTLRRLVTEPAREEAS